MKKTVKYVIANPSIPPNFVRLSNHQSTQHWKKEETTDNYLLGELSSSVYSMNQNFYSSYFSSLVRNRKTKKRDIKIYEWKEFLLFLFAIYQRTSKHKLVPKARAGAVRVFLEDFQANVRGLNGLDTEFKLSAKADKIFYLKKGDKTYLLGFLINKKLFITFPHIMNHLVDRYLNRFNRSDTPLTVQHSQIGNFHDYFTLALYGEWGVKIKPKIVGKGGVTLGADPEFLIYRPYNKNPRLADYRELQPASNIIISSHSNDELGLDGCSDLGELRPRPSPSPYTLTRNIKKLFNKFYSEYGSEYFIETGGGCGNSIGGHIHLGHECLKSFTNVQIKPLMQLLDAFLYFPIKLNMYGAVREWKDYNELNVEIDYYNGECKVDGDPEKIIHTIKRVKPLKSQQFNGFDAKGQYRSQPHGLEYRSLPSFIGDFTFTKLVFQLAKGIAEKFIELRTQGTEFTYNDPPQKEDYLVFLKEKEVKQLFEYLYGKKKDLFLKNALNNWKVIKQFFINISDNLNILNYPNFGNYDSARSQIESRLTKELQSTLRGINHSLHIHLLASNHYFSSTRFKELAHPTFIMTRHINFSTLTEHEYENFFSRLPDQNTIYIGIPYLWRDRNYIDSKNIIRILRDSIRIFSRYNKIRNNFKYSQSIDDLKKIPAYKNSRLCQVADEINDYSKLFKKEKKVKKRPKPRPSTEDRIAREIRMGRELRATTITDDFITLTNRAYGATPEDAPDEGESR